MKIIKNATERFIKKCVVVLSITRIKLSHTLAKNKLKRIKNGSTQRLTTEKDNKEVTTKNGNIIHVRIIVTWIVYLLRFHFWCGKSRNDRRQIKWRKKWRDKAWKIYGHCNIKEHTTENRARPTRSFYSENVTKMLHILSCGVHLSLLPSSKHCLNRIPHFWPNEFFSETFVLCLSWIAWASGIMLNKRPRMYFHQMKTIFLLEKRRK